MEQPSQSTRIQNAVLGCNLKNDKIISVHFWGRPFNITVIQVYAPTTDAEETEVDRFYENLQDFLELTPKKKKKCPIHHRGLECNSRKSRNTWSNRQLWLWCTKRSRAKSNRILPRESTGHRKHPFFNSTRDDFTHRHHQKVNIEIRLITFSVAKDGEAVYSQQKQDLELTVAQIISSS